MSIEGKRHRNNGVNFSATGTEADNPNGKFEFEYPTTLVEARKPKATTGKINAAAPDALRQMFPENGGSTHVSDVPRFPSGFRNYWAEEPK